MPLGYGRKHSAKRHDPDKNRGKIEGPGTYQGPPLFSAAYGEDKKVLFFLDSLENGILNYWVTSLFGISLEPTPHAVLFNRLPDGLAYGQGKSAHVRIYDTVLVEL